MCGDLALQKLSLGDWEHKASPRLQSLSLSKQEKDKAEEMVPLMKCLPCKQEYMKSGPVLWAQWPGSVTAALGVGERRKWEKGEEGVGRDRQISVAPWPASLHKSVSSRLVRDSINKASGLTGWLNREALASPA